MARPALDADDHVDADTRIAPVARHELGPPEDAVRRIAAHVRLEAEIGEPQQAGIEQAAADGGEDSSDLDANRWNVARAEDPSREGSSRR